MVEINGNSMFRKFYIKIYENDPKESIKTSCGYYLSIIGMPLVWLLKQVMSVIIAPLMLAMLIFFFVQDLLGEIVDGKESLLKVTKETTRFTAELAVESFADSISKFGKITFCFSTVITAYCCYQYSMIVMIIIVFVIIIAIIDGSQEAISKANRKAQQKIRICTPVKFAYND